MGRQWTTFSQLQSFQTAIRRLHCSFMQNIAVLPSQNTSKLLYPMLKRIIVVIATCALQTQASDEANQAEGYAAWISSYFWSSEGQNQNSRADAVTDVAEEQAQSAEDLKAEIRDLIISNQNLIQISQRGQDSIRRLWADATTSRRKIKAMEKTIKEQKYVIKELRVAQKI